MYYLYYIVLFISLDLCVWYYDYYAALKKILRAPSNTNEIGGSRHFLPPAASQEPMVVLLILRPLLSIQPPCPNPIRSGPSNPLGQSGLSLQDNLSHTVNLPKGLISPSNLMIPLLYLNIERDTMKPSLIQNPLTFLPLLRPCTALVLPNLFS